MHDRLFNKITQNELVDMFYQCVWKLEGQVVDMFYQCVWKLESQVIAIEKLSPCKRISL